MVLLQSFRPSNTNYDKQDFELGNLKKHKNKQYEQVMKVNDSLESEDI